ncbi:peptidylprolyl isomerase [filamentous cyanobacterium LEGE 11480]|uniref:Peptidyl-prolyl cis-trans isomerase n=1 Tax=Romeriopsis navalis LEGE 11480 TaxID=2777977 RepID=A0A928VV63_9CYAN|nr:peptidylprolyl isomerase [Romeriopsis navalis]MBE9033097.1 peptidylprolyl isomerase [Romeriopsis navalis LEGE 11480]
MQRAWRSWLIGTFAVVLLTTATACGEQSGTAAAPDASTTSEAPVPTASSSPGKAVTLDDIRKQFPGLPTLSEKATIQLTVKGQPVEIELDGENAPISAGNFVELIQKKFYDGLVFHRVVREPSPFVVQGGDPKGKDPNVPLDKLGTGGYIDPTTNQERRIPLEIKSSDDQPLYGGTFSQVQQFAGKSPKLKHTRGAVAMARSQNPNSASSQFYITLADVSFLDGEYAVFGKVTKGMEVVDKIQQGDRIESIRIVQMNDEAFQAGATSEPEKTAE